MGAEGGITDLEPKKLYRMEYNWYGRVEETWVRAFSEHQAFRLACANVSVQKGKTASSVRLYLGKPHKHNIKEIKEDEAGKPAKVL